MSIRGGDGGPNYRGRLLAKDFKREGDDHIFAPVLPLEALRSILVMAAAPLLWALRRVSWEGPRRIQVSFVDISKAYFHVRDGDVIVYETGDGWLAFGTLGHDARFRVHHWLCPQRVPSDAQDYTLRHWFDEVTSRALNRNHRWTS